MTNDQLDALRRSGGHTPHDVIDQAIEANALRAELSTARGLLGECYRLLGNYDSHVGQIGESSPAQRLMARIDAAFGAAPARAGKCPTCHGKGYITVCGGGERPCENCHSTGKANASDAEREKAAVKLADFVVSNHRSIYQGACIGCRNIAHSQGHADGCLVKAYEAACSPPAKEVEKHLSPSGSDVKELRAAIRAAEGKE
jgi:hypothetical protein